MASDLPCLVPSRWFSLIIETPYPSKERPLEMDNSSWKVFREGNMLVPAGVMSLTTVCMFLIVFDSLSSLTKLASTIIVNRCIHCWTFVNDSWIIDSWMQEPQCVYIYMDPIQIKTTRTSNLKILCLAVTTTMRRWKPPKGTPLKSNMSPEKGPS